MAKDETVRFFVALKPNERLLDLYRKDDRRSVSDYLNSLLFRDRPRADAVIDVVDLPSRQSVTIERLMDVSRANTGALVATLRSDWKTWEFLRQVIAEDAGRAFVGTGVDLPVYSTRHWCPSYSGPFAGRGAANRLIGFEALQEHGQLTGEGTNIALFDHGIDEKGIADNFGGGMGPNAGRTKGGHGMDMVRQILSVAPRAMIYDYPVLPPRITDLPGFLGHVYDAYQQFLLDIAYYAVTEGRTGPWIAVNAWAVFDSESSNAADQYTDEPTHELNVMIQDIAQANVDIVFASGNCGQFSPDARCGASNREPGASILGANSHPDVLTVGAVRPDAVWAGYSSQGRGQIHLAEHKPDLCAPSDFREDGDASVINTGTSTACALTAGVIAALRTGWPDLRPAELRQVLRDTARKADGPDWNSRTGFGVLNAAGALQALQAKETV